MTTLHITSEAQLHALCAEGEEIIRAVETTRTEGERTRVVVTTQDGRIGEHLPATKPSDPAHAAVTSGDLSEHEWELAACLNARHQQRTTGKLTTKWTSFTVADDWRRIPHFERVAAGRPIAARTSSYRHTSRQPGDTVTMLEHNPDGTIRRHVYLVAHVLYQPADEVNERDDATWTLECVEPTEEERAVPFVAEAIERAHQQDAHERFVYEQTMRNTNGYGN